MGSMLSVLTITWASVTALLVAALIYRALIGMKEEDQLFLASGKEHIAREQQELQARIVHLNKYATWLGILSGLLLIAAGGIWVFEELGRR